MATQIIPGAMRETNNPLLLKAEIGKPLKRGFVLPSDQFTYGKTSQGQIIGASETINWQSMKQKPQSFSADKNLGRNFIAINKAATRAGLVTAKEHFQYRATHDVTPLQKEGEYKKKSGKELPNIDIVYGVPTKPSTPVFDLLEHKYQDNWLDENTRLPELSRAMKTESQKQKKYGETRASRLRRFSPPVDQPPLWQMPKFQKNAVPALQTFRDEEARGKAFKHHASDCTARTGVFGHGIYEGAKS